MTTELQITGMTKRYGDFLLDHVSCGVPTGSIVGLIGENGAGQSTTIRGVLGMIHKEAGRIALFGQDTETIDKSRKEKVGRVIRDCQFSEELTPLQGEGGEGYKRLPVFRRADPSPAEQGAARCLFWVGSGLF